MGEIVSYAGPKRGPRKGSKHRKTIAREKAAAAADLTPVEYMLTLMRDEDLDMGTRFEAAKAVAPYVHSRLQATHTTEAGSTKSHEAWLHELLADDDDD